MAKKNLALIISGLVFIFLWLYFIGQMGGYSATSGDINMLDEGQFGAWISHMLNGKIIYRDFYYQYGPLYVYPTYILMKYFGSSRFLVRLCLGSFGVFLGLIVAGYLILKLKIRFVVGFVAMIFLLLIPGINIRHFLGVLCIAWIVEAVRKKSLFNGFLSGVLLCLAFLQSTEVGIFITIIYICYLFIRIINTKGMLWEISFVGSLLSGVFVTLLVFVIVAYNGGWLKDYLHTSYEIVTSLSGINLPNGQGLPNILTQPKTSFSLYGLMQFIFSKSMLFYWSLLILLVFLSIQCIRYLLHKTTSRDTAIIMIISYALIIYASIIGRSGHYFIIFPFVILCGAYLLSILLSLPLPTKKLRFFQLLCVLLFLLYGIRHLIVFKYSAFSNLKLVAQKNRYIPKVSPLLISNKQANDILSIQNYFNLHTKTSDKIFVVSNAPALYILLNRENSTQYDLPLLAGTIEKRYEIVNSLISDPPLIIVEEIKPWAVDEVSERERLPEVFEFIDKYYKKFEKVGSFFLYKRNNIEFSK